METRIRTIDREIKKMGKTWVEIEKMEKTWEEMEKMGKTWGEIEKIATDRGKWRVLVSALYVQLGMKRISK